MADLAGATSVSFAGRTWAVKTAPGTYGPGPNYWSDRRENVWVDVRGRLHLRITARGGRWYCAEVFLPGGLGYGTYRFAVASPLAALDPNVVLGLFTWADDPAYQHREIDVEVARWGQAADPTNAQFVVQPAGQPGHLTRFTLPAGPVATVHSFTWSPGRVAFSSTTVTGSPIAATAYSGPDVPVPGSERLHINLWLYAGLAPVSGAETEVVLSGFAFTPAARIAGPDVSRRLSPGSDPRR